MIQPELYTPDQAALALGVSRTTIFRMLKANGGKPQLSYVRILGKDRRIPRTEILRFIQDNTVTGS